MNMNKRIKNYPGTTRKIVKSHKRVLVSKWLFILAFVGAHLRWQELSEYFSPIPGGECASVGEWIDMCEYVGPQTEKDWEGYIRLPSSFHAGIRNSGCYANTRVGLASELALRELRDMYPQANDEDHAFLTWAWKN
jgi:hypothetical protein